MKILFVTVLSLTIFFASSRSEIAEEEAFRISQIIQPKISDDEWRSWVKEKVSETYEVQNGDTLWGVSRLMFGNSFLWPKLWTINTTTIGNPHVLEPGYILMFNPNSANPVLMNQIESATSSDLAEWQKINKEAFNLNFPKYSDENVVVSSTGELSFNGQEKAITLNYFVSLEQDSLGQISSSDLTQIFLETNAGVGGQGEKIPSTGTVIIARRDIELDSDSSVFKIVGHANISENSNGSFKAKITKEIEPIKRGDYLFSNVSVNLSEIPNGRSSKKQTGKIINQAGSGFGYFSKGAFVVVNLGTEDGLLLGEALDIVSNDNNNEEAQFIYKRGKLKIVNISSNYSIGLILEATQIIERNATVVSPETVVGEENGQESTLEPVTSPEENVAPDENSESDNSPDLQGPTPEEENLLEEPIKDEDLQSEETDEGIPSFENSEPVDENVESSSTPTEPVPEAPPSNLDVEKGTGLDPDSLDELSDEEKDLLNSKPEQ